MRWSVTERYLDQKADPLRTKADHRGWAITGSLVIFIPIAAYFAFQIYSRWYEANDLRTAHRNVERVVRDLGLSQGRQVESDSKGDMPFVGDYPAEFSVRFRSPSSPACAYVFAQLQRLRYTISFVGMSGGGADAENCARGGVPANPDLATSAFVSAIKNGVQVEVRWNNRANTITVSVS